MRQPVGPGPESGGDDDAPYAGRPHASSRGGAPTVGRDGGSSDLGRPEVYSTRLLSSREP